MAISEKPLTLEQPPDLVVEIASPRQSINGLVRRCIWYTENGVGIALLVDPDRSANMTVTSRRSSAKVCGSNPATWSAGPPRVRVGADPDGTESETECGWTAAPQ